MTADELKLGRSRPASGFGTLKPGQVPSDFYTLAVRTDRVFAFQDAGLLGGNPDCDPDADDHQRYEDDGQVDRQPLCISLAGCSFTGRILHTPFWVRKNLV